MQTPEKLGTEFQVNTHTPFDQSNSVTAALSDGGFVIAWESWEQDGSDSGIFGQRYDVEGKKAGPEFQINTETNEHQLNPSISARPGGGFVVTWDSYGQDGSKEGIFGQLYAADGNKSGVEFQINTHETGFQGDASVTSMNDGSFVVTWTSFEHGEEGAGIYGQRFSSDGTLVGPEFHVNSYTSNDQGSPSIATLTDGGFVVTWQSLDQDGSSFGIYGQRYNANGIASGTEFRINSVTDDNQSAPTATALTGGGFVVSWKSDNQDGDGVGVYAQRYDANGDAQGPSFQVNSETASHQLTPATAALADGGFVITWSSLEQDGDALGIYGQRFDADGKTVGSEFRINTQTAGSQFDSSVTALKNGGFVVTWGADGQDGDGEGIFAQQFKAQLFGTSKSDILSDKGGADWMNGQAGSDILKGLNGNDQIYGNKGNDKINGGNGQDKLFGDAGKDDLTGGKGKDKLFGGEGRDTLSGGKGNDKLKGNAGHDKFVFKKQGGDDTITDFQNGKDKIDLSAFNFSSKSKALAKFYEMGNDHNDKLGFDHKGTEITIKGIDMGDLGGADLII